MSLLFLGFSIGATVWTLFRRLDIFSPARIYFIIYSLLLSVNSLKLSRIQTPWVPDTHIYFWGACFFFICGAGLMGFVTQSKFPSWRLDFKEIKLRLREDADRIDWRHFFKIWAGCVFIFLIGYVTAYLKTGQIPVFASNTEDARARFLQANLISYYSLAFGPISLMFAVEAFMFGRFTRKKKMFLWWGFFLVLFLYLTVVTRFDIFRFGIFAMVLFHYGRKNLRWQHLLGGVLAATLVFFLAFLIRVNQDAVGALSEAIQIKLPKEWLWASGIYSYLANDFWNMNYAFQKFGDGLHEYPMQWGLGSLRVLIADVLRIEPGLIKTFGYDNVMNGMITRVRGLNTVVYVWHFYKDFGTIGVFGMTLFAGIWTAKVHKNLLLSPSLKQLALWGCITGAIVLSFHIPSWELWFFVVNVVVLMFAHRYSPFLEPTQSINNEERTAIR